LQTNLKRAHREPVVKCYLTAWDNKKLSYRRDSVPCGHYAVQSFIVTDMCTNRKPVCHFLLVNDTQLTSYLVPFPSYRAVLVTFPLSTGKPLFDRRTRSPYVCKYHQVSKFPKKDSLGYISVADSVGITLIGFKV